ncbi:hypothetical protein PT974_11549 [Cladobotryum mycophilum]|uniref:Uncharacterized protein n=1 Tax=Cladobotryum mycophilum TaxID=491253 RepID=A0ABR0S6D7_9HYPO
MARRIHHYFAHQWQPRPLQRSDSMHSRYVQMLLQQDEIPTLHNILGSAFVWLLLAGFLFLPGTFTTLQKSVESKSGSGDDWESQAAKAILKSVRNIPLLAIAAVMCGISASGMFVLSIIHRRNYVWLVNKLFLPGMTNSLAGLVSTLIGVYTQQHGTWSITAKVTAIVEGASLGICGSLFVIYELALLGKVKESHGQHYRGWPGSRHSKQLFPEKV